jgi:hypothetical protein
MKADLRTEIELWNKNVDELIRLLQNIQSAGEWSRQETARHEARLEALRTKLNADFKELIALRKHVGCLASAGEITVRDR